MRLHIGATAALALACGLVPSGAAAQTVDELQRQIDDLKAAIAVLEAAVGKQAASARALPEIAEHPPLHASDATGPATPAEGGKAVEVAAASPAKAWYDKLRVRGYTQLRNNEIVSGDKDADSGEPRLRSVHDRSVGDDTNFFIRRARLVFQGDINDRVSFYLQPDFAAGVSNQTAGERRENFVQLRDAYVDIHLDDAKTFKIRAGQSKVPFGWENLQSSSNRLALDRADAINSAVPGERDLGLIAYYTPRAVDAIWDRLAADGQKLFGNYGAFGFGIFNGQGINRGEQNDNLQTVAMATWPFELDALGDAFAGQVFELGISAMRNRVQPEVRTGGVSAEKFKDDRVGFHAVLYPQPIGFQAEWNWGKGPEFDLASNRIEAKNLNGGYVQLMGRIDDFLLGDWMPYAKWQRYRGGWKAATNAPRLETDELELGVEWRIMRPLELTLAWAHMERTEADERRPGQAEGNVLRTQLQWNY